MGNFQNNAITDVGKMLLADVQAGAVFTPTRIVIGSGTMPSGATTQGMTDVITPVKSLAINKKKRTPDGKCIFGGVYTNVEVTEPFYFRELALYAKAVYYGDDGSVVSEGAETLYSYGNAGATADYMAAYSTSTVVEKQMDLVTWVGNDAQVDLTIETAVFVVQGDFEAHAARHAAGGEDPITPEDIGAAPAGYGLGGQSHFLSTTDDLNNVIDNGWYSWHVDTPANAPAAWGNMIVTSQHNHYTQTVILFAYLGSMLQRACIGDTWSEWEWVNPPLETDVEYRTTERRNSVAVYKKMGADGVLRYRLDGTSTWLTYASENGAVKKAGDTMTDDLYIAKAATPSLRLTSTGDGAGAVIQMGNQQLLLASRDVANSLENSRVLAVNTATRNADVAKAIRLIDRVAGVESYYDILHTGNIHLYGLAAVDAQVE